MCAPYRIADPLRRSYPGQTPTRDSYFWVAEILHKQDTLLRPSTADLYRKKGVIRGSPFRNANLATQGRRVRPGRPGSGERKLAWNTLPLTLGRRLPKE